MAHGKHADTWGSRLLLAAILLFTPSWAKGSAPIDYCSGFNTGSSFSPLRSIYQSDGLCQNNCTSLGYALAVVQDKNCWCSNYTPAESVRSDINNCKAPCPGYPADWCGGDDYFGYMVLEKSASGTLPAASTPAPAPAPAPSSTSTTTTSSDSTTSPDSTHSRPSETPSPVIPVVSTVTLGGTIMTVTATPSVNSGLGMSPGPDVASRPTSSDAMSGGAKAGIAVGVIGGLALVGGMFWLWRRHKASKEQADGNLQTRSSSRGMLGSFGNDRHSMSETTSVNRRSTFNPVDPRLDYTKTLFSQDNLSQSSVPSLRDDTDYSRRVHQSGRVLRATNPDPPEP